MIAIFTTGGTIEGLEYDKSSQAPLNPPVTVLHHLQSIKNLPSYSIKKIFSKDSRFITDKDRQVLLLKIKKCKATKILITHGTLSMVETAKYIGQQNVKKRIVLTGSFKSGNSLDTDAVENLRFAMNSLESPENGTFIAMHNTVFPYDRVVKNISENRFEYLAK